jgi:hypothetical protein
MSRGRRRVYDRPVARTISIESWVDSLIVDLKKMGLSTNDIIITGLMTTLKSEGKFPTHILKSLVITLDSRIAELQDLREYYDGMAKKLENLSEEKQKEAVPEPSARRHWTDEFHVVRLVGEQKYFWLEKAAYEKDPGLFEIMDPSLDIDCSNLEKYYSVDAVIKVQHQQESQKNKVSI